MVSCSGEKYTSDDVIAILDGEAITGLDIMARYQLEDKFIKMYLQEEVVIAEAKDRGLVVSDEELIEKKQALFPGATPNEIYQMLDETEFYEKQAAILGMKPVEYYEMWHDTYYYREAYFQKYVEEFFETPNYSIDGLSEEEIEDLMEEGQKWGRKIEAHIEELFALYQEDGRLILY